MRPRGRFKCKNNALGIYYKNNFDHLLVVLNGGSFASCFSLRGLERQGGRRVLRGRSAEKSPTWAEKQDGSKPS